MTIRPATTADIPSINQLAEAIWWPTYQPILSSKQISFMLEKMYSNEALTAQMLSEDILFLMVEQEEHPAGFAAFSLTDPENQVYKIHKLYVLPEQQGKGTGRALIDYIAEVAAKKGGKILELNVNRGNPALFFYKKIGFTIHEETDIPYYEFVLNDYILRKPL